MSLPIVPEKIRETLKAPGQPNETDLVERSGQLVCPQTGATYRCDEGVPRLMRAEPAVPAPPQRRPSYAGIEEFGELVSKGYSDPFRRGLLKAIGTNKRVLDCGCGTGQLSHFLQLNNNQVLGVDTSLEDLRLAMAHRAHNQLTRVAFALMDPFDLAIKDASMDVAVVRHALQRASDPARSLQHVVSKVRRGGLVLVGVHSSFVPSGNSDPRHTIDEVLAWLAASGVDYVACRPAVLGTDGEDSAVFAPSSPGSRYARFVTQLAWFFTNRRDGGTFDVLGRRR